MNQANTGASDQFGFCVALSADGSPLAVVASSEASAATGVFTRSGTIWGQQAYVKASNIGRPRWRRPSARGRPVASAQILDRHYKSAPAAAHLWPARPAPATRQRMGQLEMFAQRTFAEETERITGGAAQWQEPAELRLEKVTPDGFLAVRRPDALARLPHPWPLASSEAEVMLELKLAGNHLDRLEVEKALLRRQARQVQRVALDPTWRGEAPLWLVTSHLPAWLAETYTIEPLAPGCSWLRGRWQSIVWIAANELPLEDALIPFLLARSGQALDEFVRWAALRRPFDWVLTMLEFLPMSTLTREDLLWRFGESDDPEIEARRQHILQVLLEADPKTKQRLIDQAVGQAVEQAHLAESREALRRARASLRRVLARRQLTLSPDEDAQIDACAELATLERWLDQAVTAASAREALS